MRASALPSNSCRNDSWHLGKVYGDIPCFLDNAFQSAMMVSICSREIPVHTIFSSVDITLFESPSIDLAQSSKASSIPLSSSCVFSILSNKGPLSSRDMPYSIFLTLSKVVDTDSGADIDESNSYASWADVNFVSIAFTCSRNSSRLPKSDASCEIFASDQVHDFRFRNISFRLLPSPES